MGPIQKDQPQMTQRRPLGAPPASTPRCQQIPPILGGEPFLRIAQAGTQIQGVLGTRKNAQRGFDRSSPRPTPAYLLKRGTGWVTPLPSPDAQLLFKSLEPHPLASRNPALGVRMSLCLQLLAGAAGGPGTPRAPELGIGSQGSSWTWVFFFLTPVL